MEDDYFNVVDEVEQGLEFEYGDDEQDDCTAEGEQDEHIEPEEKVAAKHTFLKIQGHEWKAKSSKCSSEHDECIVNTVMAIIGHDTTCQARSPARTGRVSQQVLRVSADCRRQ